MTYDNRDAYDRLAKHYFKPMNQKVLLIILAMGVVWAIMFSIFEYQQKLNASYETKLQKMEEVRATISQDTHIKNFKAVITYQ